MKMKVTKLAMAIGPLMIAGAVAAGSDTGTITASATVDAACVIGTGGDLAFGSLALLDAAGSFVASGNKDVETTIPLACTNGTSGVSFTFGAAGTGFQLASSSTPADTITYTLWANTTRTNPIARNTPVTSDKFDTFAADGTNVSLKVYGRISLTGAQAAKVHNDYTDSVAVTVSY